MMIAPNSDMPRSAFAKDLQSDLPSDLLAALPPVRGKYLPEKSLADLCWFRVGGAADIVFLPADEEDLAQFLRAVPPDVPLQILGAGSNILPRDGGVRGVTIRLGSAFGKINQSGDTQMSAGAGALDVRLARLAAAADLSGLEFMSGIPGAVGGAVAMNAGAYGRETGEVLASVDALDRQGRALRLSVDELDLAYRHNGYGDFIIYVQAHFNVVRGETHAIAARMDEIAAKRGDTQPIKARTGGSTFKNPEGAKAWQLIEQAGCRGLRQGDAQMSELHCNFMINHGAATASDLEQLGETVRQNVQQTSGIALEWEIHRIGEKLGGQDG
ncbi:MAG: UDP-N-acetylmuramate dehydrogenase [Parvibaculales bacterium]